MAATGDFEGCVTHGPWGAKSGTKWVYKPQVFTKKMKIIVGHGGCVESLSFQTNCDSGEVQTSFFGGSDAYGYKTDTICIDYPSEYLMSISGTTYGTNTDTFLMSISFTTNLKVYGPYGTEAEKADVFSYDVNGEVVVGFHGHCSSKFISAFGVYSMPKSLALAPNPTFTAGNVTNEGSSRDFDGCITHGPWGGSEGHKWVYMPLPPIGLNKKMTIMIQHGVVVDSIAFQTNNKIGDTSSSSFGGTGGNQINRICIDHPNEYIISVSGKVGKIDGSDVVKSICFMTNLKFYGPYGNDSGTVFSYDIKDGNIVGFHGRLGKYLTAIGVYAVPKRLPSVRNPTQERQMMDKVCSKMSRMTMPRDAGPWGTGGGKSWDDGVFSNIKTISVHIGEDDDVICAIQFQYLKSDGSSVWSKIHGKTDNDCTIKYVDLNVKDEFLTGISGFYGRVEDYGPEAIVSITLHSSVRDYGPYGGEENGEGHVYFRSSSPGKVVGFQGKENGFLSAIGVHMEYVF